MAFDIIPPNSPEYQQATPRVVIETRPRGRFWPRLIAFFFITTGLSFGAMALKAGTTFNLISEGVSSFLGIDASRLPVGDPREKGRMDILLLGLRGAGDEHGGLLTDMMLVVSIDTARNTVALISIPRDIYLTIPIVNERAKINEAFSIGERKQSGGGGLVLARLAVQEVLGINIDYAASVDFQAFQDSIDLLGGVDVHVAKPLHEAQQWSGIEIIVPAGVQHMDSEKALYYVRSRFSTSDFDRVRRQQEVLLAIRDKALSLGFLAQPAKVVTALNILGRHVRTDIEPEDVSTLYAIAEKVAHATPKRLVLDTTAVGMLRSSSVDGAYVLLPADGSFEAIRTRAQHIFDTAAVNASTPGS